MEIFLDRLFSGLTAGCVYALIALALVVVFRSSSTINFAQGEFALFTCFIAWWFTDLGVTIYLAAVIAVVVGFVMGIVIEPTLIRPIRKRSETGVLLVGLGLFTALNGLDGWLFGPEDRPFPSVFPQGADKYISVFGSRLHFDAIGLMAVTALVVYGLHALLTYTSLGLRMRAVAADSESAALSGVRVGQILSLSWGLSAAIGSLAGVLLIPVLPPNQLSLYSFFSVLIFAAASALLGGLDSIKGAVVAGLIFGVAERMINGYVSFLSGLGLTFALFIIVVVLVFRPTGLYGTRRIERV